MNFMFHSAGTAIALFPRDQDERKVAMFNPIIIAAILVHGAGPSLVKDASTTSVSSANANAKVDSGNSVSPGITLPASEPASEGPVTSAEMLHFRDAAGSNTAQAYRDFLKKHGTGSYAERAKDALERAVVKEVVAKYPQVYRPGRIPPRFQGLWVSRRGGVTSFLAIGSSGTLEWSGTAKDAQVEWVKVLSTEVRGDSLSYKAPVVYADESFCAAALGLKPVEYKMPLRIALTLEGDALRVAQEKKEVKARPKFSCPMARWRHAEMTFSSKEFYGSQAKNETRVFAGGDTFEYERFAPSTGK